MIYLYLKTHNKTGYSYLGKTVATDPYKYEGSGKLWRRHIKKHGYDVTTKILAESESKDEIKNLGIYYSNIWNVVENKNFANLIPETGDGGAHAWTAESRKKSFKKFERKKTYRKTKRKMF